MNLTPDDVKRIAQESANEIARELRAEWVRELLPYREFIRRVLRDFYGEQLDGDAQPREGIFSIVKRNDDRMRWLILLVVLELVISMVLLAKAF